MDKEPTDMDRELKRSGIEWESIFQAIGHPAIILDPQHSITAVNRATIQLTGRPAGELIGKKCFEIFHGRDTAAPPEGCPMEKLIASGRFETFEMEMEAFGGMFLVSCTPVLDEQGNLEKVIHIATDITEQRKAVDELRDNEIRFRAVFERSVDAIGVSKNGVHVFVNPSYLSLFGYASNEELAGRPIIDFIAPEEREKILDNVRRRAAGDPVPSAYETRGLKKDGTVFDMDVHVSSYELSGDTFTLVILRDITERKRYEESLRASEEKYRDLFENAIDPIVILDAEHNFVDMNKSAVRLLGYSREEFLHMKVFDIIPPEQVPESAKEFEKLQMEGKYEKFTGKVGTKDGRWLDVEVSSSAIVKDGRIVGSRDILRDITDRKRSAELLQESEERFRILLDKGFDGIFIHENLIILDMNQRLSDISGYSHSELLHSKVINLFTRDSQERIYDYIRSGRRGYYEVELLRKDGKIVSIEAFGSNCRFDGRDARIVAIRDITEQKKLQEQLRQSQKMEAIGHLAGGVAHDFNNILSAIVGYTHLTLMKMKEDDPLRANLQHVLDSSEKAANLTQSLLAFSRKQVMAMKTVNLNEIVHGMMKIFDRVIGEDIKLRLNTAVHDLIVKADKNQIEQALMNLVTNARDAIPHGGMITITTEEIEIDEGFIRMNLFGESGRYAVITITDTGQGMDEKTKENIFEPFFTTKEVGKGTGLGLAMVYGTIRQHNGFINVYSSPGQGTTFRIYLPLVKAAVQTVEEEAERVLSSGDETVLLVEDDDAVRMSTKALLEMSGYTVMEAADGEHAIRLFREHRDVIQIVISDIIMPGQSGKDVYEEMKKIKSGLKVLFISGYPYDMLTRKGILAEGVNFISKPLRPDVLLRKVREVLDMQGPE